MQKRLQRNFRLRQRKTERYAEGKDMETEHKRHFGSVLSAAVLLFVLLCGCSSKQEDIVILYTNDVHCAVDGQTGYAGLIRRAISLTGIWWRCTRTAIPSALWRRRP